MTQLMGEKPGNDLIPIISATDLCDRLMAGVDFDIRVIGASAIGILWVPIDMDMDPAVVFISPGLGCSNILKMASQDPGGEKLPVCDLAAAFIQKLFYSLVVYSRHGNLPFSLSGYFASFRSKYRF